MLEDRSEAHDADPEPAESVIDGMIVIGVGRAQAVQCSVPLRRVQPESRFPQIGNRVLIACLVVQFEGPELRLRVRQDVFRGRELHDVLGIPRTKRQALPSTNDLPPQAQSNSRNSVCEAQWRDWVEIARSHYAGEVRVKAPAVDGAHDLLEDHCHLLLFQPIRRGSHICFGMPAEGGSVDAFDRLHELLQAHVEVRILVGQHEGFVYTGKRQILGVLQQAGRTHRQGIAYFRQKCQQVLADRQRE